MHLFFTSFPCGLSSPWVGNPWVLGPIYSLFLIYQLKCYSVFIHHCRIFRLSEMIDLLEAEQLITMDTVQQVKQFLSVNQTVAPPKPSSVKKLRDLVIIIICLYYSDRNLPCSS